MGGVAHEPEPIDRGAVGETEGTKSGDALPNAAHNAAIASGISRKGAWSSGFYQLNGVVIQREKLAQTGDRLIGVALFQSVVIVIPPLASVRKRRSNDRCFAVW